VNGSQHTVIFHIDDLKSSHQDKQVNNEFLKWLNKVYGSHKEVTCTRGKIHKYLGMQMDYSEAGKIVIDMRDYIQKMIKEFPTNLRNKKPSPTPAGHDLFDQHDNIAYKKLEPTKKELFHSMVAKGLFLASRGRPDIQLTIAHLCTRVQEPTTNNWEKLERMMSYLYGTRNLVRTIKADDVSVIKWFVDTSFAVHHDYKSHTGMAMCMGHGTVTTMSRKQKLNTLQVCTQNWWVRTMSQQ
jgi:hypothetical protein